MSTQTVKNVPAPGKGSMNSPSDWQHYAAQGTERMQEIIQDNAGKSMLLAFAAGLGVGVLVGTAIGGSSQSSRWWDRQTAESLGQRVLDKLGTMVPDALAERFHR